MADNVTFPGEALERRYRQIIERIKSGPLSDRTHNAQFHCLAALSIYLLGYFGLVEIQKVTAGGLELGMSLNVLAFLAFVYGSYQYARFASGAHIEFRRSAIEAKADLESLPRLLKQWGNIYSAWLDEAKGRQQDFEAKIAENRAFAAERNQQKDAIRQQFRPRLDDMLARQSEAQRRAEELEKAGDREEASRLLREVGDAGQEWLVLHEEMEGRLKPIEDRPYPYPESEMTSASQALIALTFSPPEPPEYNKLVRAAKLERRQALFVACLDVLLPTLLLIASIVMFISWPAQLAEAMKSWADQLRP